MRAFVAAVVVGLVAAMAGVSGAAAAPPPGGRPVCTTPASDAPNVNTDCETDGNNFETTLAVNPTDHTSLVGAAMKELVTFGSGGQPRFRSIVRPHVSSDNGRSWTTYALDYTGYRDTIDPAVDFDATATVYLAVAASPAGANGDIVVNHSDDGGRTWSPAVLVGPASGSQGGAGTNNDFPHLAAWGDGQVIVTWIQTEFGAQGNARRARVFDSVSHDHGATWSDPTPISGSAPFCVGAGGGDACNQAFGSTVAKTRGGPAVVTFQDTYQVAPSGDTNQGRNMWLSVIVDPASGQRTDGPFLVGQAFDGINEHDYPVDFRGAQTLHDSQFNLDSVGNVTADPTDAAGKHLAVVWYDDRHAPHPVDPDPYSAVTDSDIVVSQTFDGGHTWSRPTTIRQSNDQFMPWAAYDRSGRLRVGYLDRSYDPANHKYGHTLATETAPGSLAFTTERVSTRLSDPTRDTAVPPPITFNPAFPNPAPGIGDYTALVVTGRDVLAYWTDMREQGCISGQCGSKEDAFFARVPIP